MKNIAVIFAGGTGNRMGSSLPKQFLKVNGRCLFLKGDNVKEEINNAKNALKILKCDIENIYKYNYEVNNEIYSRNILQIIKKDIISSKYPRNFGKIKKSPL